LWSWIKIPKKHKTTNSGVTRQKLDD
jgi:hypothetical protein